MNRGHPEELISASLTDELTQHERGELDRHLADCDRCWETLAAFVEQRQRIGSLPRATTPDHLVSRIRAALARTRPAPAPGRRPLSAVAFAVGASAVSVVAAVAVVALALRGGWLARDSGAATTPAATASERAELPVPTPTPVGSSATAEAALESPTAVAGTMTWDALIFDRPERPAYISSITAFRSSLVAVGRANWDAGIWTLPEGGQWQRVQDTPDMPGDGIELFDVAATPFGLVAVGLYAPEFPTEYDGTVIWWSSDGATWIEAQRIDGVYLRAVTAGGPGVVAVGQPPTCCVPGREGESVWTSTDGRTWVVAPSAAAIPEAMFTDVARTEAGLVGVGELDPRVNQGSRTAAVWQSVDGLVWTRVPDGPVFADSYMTSVVASSTGLFAVGAGGTFGVERPVVWQSADGVTWERLAAEIDGAQFSRVTEWSGGLIAVGSVANPASAVGARRPAGWRSSDGVAWTLEPDLPALGDGQLFDVIDVGNGVLAVGETGTDFVDLQPLLVTGRPR